MMALTRLPSGSRASTIGLVSSTRRPTRPDDPLDDLDQVAVVVEDDAARLQPPLALDVDQLGPVDQDVGDRRVAHQRLERAEAERLVEHLADQPLALAEVEQVGAVAGKLLGGLADLEAEFLLVHRADDRQVHAGDELLVQLPFEVEETILGRRRRRPRSIAFGLESAHSWFTKSWPMNRWKLENLHERSNRAGKGNWGVRFAGS